MHKTLVVILGPTAVGKTSLSIELSQWLKTEIISCDSRQFYKELDAGTAKPSKEELNLVKHHFINHISVKDYYNASMFEQEVLNLLINLFQTNDVVIMVGGSGMYIDAVCKGIDDLPTVDPEIRNKLIEEFKTDGIESLRLKLKKLDPEYYTRVDLKNPNRLLKAIEVALMTGRPYSEFLTKPHKVREFDIIKIGLNGERDALYDRINQRVDDMMQNGLLIEAREFYPIRHLNALNTVGYKELFQCIDGEITIEKAIELIKRNSRHYARRQMTWFRRDKDIRWFEPSDKDDIKEYITSLISL
jgi:tRNA dimethylallyltransferase